MLGSLPNHTSGRPRGPFWHLTYAVSSDSFLARGSAPASPTGIDMVRSQAKPPITKGKFDNVDIRAARVIDVSDPVIIADGAGTSRPFRVLKLDLAELGVKQSVGQFALVHREELMDRLVLVVCNLSARPIGASGEYISEVLTLGTRHPQSPPDQSQAVPIYAHSLATANDIVY